MNKILLVLVLSITLFINAQENTGAFKKTMKIEGRIQYDFNFLTAGDYSYAGNEFRRMRLSAKGVLAKNVAYKLEFDFAGGESKYRDIYLKFLLPYNFGSLKLGSFTEPASLDIMTSSKYITFFERSMLSATQPFKYNAGFMYENYNLLDKKVNLQLAYTFNGDKKNVFKDTDIDSGANLIVRVTGAAINNKEKHQVVHLGLNYERRDDDDESYTYNLRTENHMGKKTKVGVSNGFQNTSDLGFELATTFGSLSIQGEYEMGSISAKDDILDTNKTNIYKTRSYYAFVSYFLTGEHRPYKKGTFGRVKPKSNFCLKDGNWGAVELVARYSVVDFNGYDVDDLSDDDIKITNITAGFNWYLNNHTRIMYNYVSGDFNDIDPFGDNEKLAGHLLRFQIDF